MLNWLGLSIAGIAALLVAASIAGQSLAHFTAALPF